MQTHLKGPGPDRTVHVRQTWMAIEIQKRRFLSKNCGELRNFHSYIYIVLFWDMVPSSNYKSKNSKQSSHHFRRDTRFVHFSQSSISWVGILQNNLHSFVKKLITCLKYELGGKAQNAALGYELKQGFGNPVASWKHNLVKQIYVNGLKTKISPYTPFL